jgi:hypothetical protein
MRQNIELSRRTVAAFNGRDVEAFVAPSDPRGEFRPLLATSIGAVYHGHQGLRQWFRDMAEAWEGDVWMEPEAYFDLGERTLAFYLLRGRGRQSGAAVAMQGAVVVTWREGLLVYMKSYSDRADALSDLGLSEDKLEPIAP